MSFNSNFLFEFNFFMISSIFFFHNDCWTVQQHWIHYAKNVAQISQRWNWKKFIDQRPCFVFKKCCQFFVNIFLHVFNQCEHFQKFIQNTIFDSDLFDQTSQIFFIRGICINCFFKFQSFYFAYDLLFVIVCMKISLSILFILWISEHLTQFFHFLNCLTAFIVSIKIELIICLFLWHRFFHRSLQSFLQWQRESVDLSDVL